MTAPVPDLSRFFAPRAVALLGASEDQTKFGGRCMRQLIDFGYPGPIYPVNPNRSEIFGLKAYPSLADVPTVPDHVGILLPAQAVPTAIAQCVARGVPFATVFSSGFGESATEAGSALQQQIVQTARAGGLRLMGPNCNGLISFVDAFALTATAAINGPRRPAGELAVFGQSGGATQVNTMWRAQQLGLGISYQASCGNAADIGLLDFAAFALEHAGTRAVLLLAERLPGIDTLRAVAGRAAELDKPILMVKAGRSAIGRRAAASHTGAVTGEDEVCDAALAQLGILRVDDSKDLYEAAMLLRRGRRPRGRRVAAMSISGGNLVQLSDLAALQGLQWPAYAEETTARLNALMPAFGAVSNPTDLTGGAAMAGDDALARAARIVLEDPAVDTMIPVFTLARAAEIRAVAAMSEASDKPVAMLWTGAATDDPTLTPESLVAAGHAVYRDAIPCAKAVRLAADWAAHLARRARPAPARPAGFDADAARALLAAAGGPLAEHRSKDLLAACGIEVPRERLAATAAEAIAAAREFGGPVALKIQSADIPHKTEAGGVRLGVSGDEAVRAAFDDVLAAAHAFAPAARIDGVLVQPMAPPAPEMIAGILHDPSFGPVVAFGLGGIHVEILKDVAFLLPPFDADAAREALLGLRSIALLQGARGAPAADLDAFADLLVRVGWMAADLGDAIAEVDLNPVRVLPRGQGVRILDALVVPRTAAHG